jgi:hypothetical protein
LRSIEFVIAVNDLIFALNNVKHLVRGSVQVKRRTALRWAQLFDNSISLLGLLTGYLAGDLVADDIPRSAFAWGSDDRTWYWFWHVIGRYTCD